MLALDDPIWGKLKHAYGVASDIPQELMRLTGRQRLPKDYWIDLWSSLCHQYTVYPASYAAFPHIVSAAQKLDAKNRFDAMFLASGIAACSLIGKRPRIPPKLSKPFNEAIAFGRRILSTMASDERKGFQETIHFVAMIAAFDGQSQLTGLLWSLADGFYCPACGKEFENPAKELSPF